jgi:hypothetical protein
LSDVFSRRPIAHNARRKVEREALVAFDDAVEGADVATLTSS